MTRRSYYWCEIQKKVVEGIPPIKEKIYGQAPTVIFDSMPRTYHEAAQREIESRKEWAQADKEHGTITFGSAEQAKPRISEHEEKKKKRAELRKASKTALDVYRANPKEVADKLEKQREAQAETISKTPGLKSLINKAIKTAGQGE